LSRSTKKHEGKILMTNKEMRKKDCEFPLVVVTYKVDERSTTYKQIYICLPHQLMSSVAI
jgi:hypothetical protein